MTTPPQHPPFGEGYAEFREVARILAEGVLRLRARHALPEQVQSEKRNLSESGRNVLDVSDDISLSGHSG